MKTLQNNFTTPKQSKRLLALGMPADSADCYWHPKNRRNEKSMGYWSRPIILTYGHTLGYEQSYIAYYDLLPCWSVGRLMEVFELCYIDKLESHTWYNHKGKGNSVIERVLWDFEDKKDQLDFSRLGE